MPQIINTNIASLTAQRNLNTSQSANTTALERLSSGLRITSAKDDAAGLAISTRFESQVKGLNVAIRNAGDGISLAQTAEGALGAMTENLQRIRELAVQSANATNSDDDRVALQQEVTQLISEITRTAEETNFNGRNLLDGTFEGTFQIGADAGQTVDVKISELTASKLGSADTAGVSAIGTDFALANGDLTINGVSIDASQAGDDTASTDNAAASAISKAAAINRQSDETGVTAYVDTNVVSGSEMVADSGTTTLTLNGIDIDLSTAGDTTQTRAAVAEAINAVADQTGVTAINTGVDAGGVQLIAEDGRNIQVAFSNTIGIADVAEATGLAAAGTYEGGFTLVADPDVGEIAVDGGNGTGNGDLANSGLQAGTYERGVATAVSTVQSDTTQATSLSAAGGSLTNTIGNTSDTATLIGAGATYTNTVYGSAAAAAAATTASDLLTIRAVTASGGATAVTLPSGGSFNSAIALVDGMGVGVTAFEQIDFTIADYTTETGGNIFYIAGQTITLPDDVTGAGYDTQTDRLQYLTDQLANTTFATGVTVTAELNFSGTEISVSIRNENTAGTVQLAFGTGANGAMTMTGSIAGAALGGAGVATVSTLASASVVVGQIGFEATGGSPVTLQFVDGTAGTANNDLFTGSTAEFTSYGTTNLASSSKNVVSVSVDGINQGDITLNEDSTVANLADQINTNYEDVNAWEEITLVIDDTNLEVGDALYFGTNGSAEASGVAVAIIDSDGDGSVTISDVADAINGTDFSGQNMDISASLNSAGDEITVTVRNFSGNEVNTSTEAEGRALQVSGGDLIGSVQQSLSGALAYSATGSQQVDLTVSDTEATGEFYTGASNVSSFTGVNGLSEGDLVLNDVNIGAALTTADTASAEYASDGTRILSSSKEKSGIAIAAAINEVSDETGVEATVNATEVVGGDGTNVDTSQFEIGDTAEIYINGYSAGVVTMQADGSGAIDTDRAKADALDLINGIAGKTGVTAVDNGVSLTLSAADGRNVSVAIDDQAGSDASIGALFGMDAAVDGIGESTFGEEPSDTNNGISAESATYETTYSTVRLDSAGEFTVRFGSEGADELTELGLKEGSYGGATDGTFLKDVDISTFQGAQDAITAIDNALKTVSSQRAELGALQNRFESTSSNLQITSENLAAANSRIRDADFAAETAELSRTQVLQQAGISILAQANQRPQQVLSLLG